MQSDNRPLSPHMQIYKRQWTWVPSILHRISGALITFGALVLVYWLVALASGPEAYENAQAVLGSFLGQLVLFLLTLAFFYHFLNGIRHLVWDFGSGLTVEKVEGSAKLIAALTVVLTVLTWILAYMLGGA